MSALRKNILANYVSQIYSTVIGILVLPFYIKYLGSEAYGLVGFFTMLQIWFGLLDLGLTPTIGRETALYKGGVTSPLTYLRLHRALSIIFFMIAFIGGSLLLFLSEYISSHWLKVDSLTPSQVIISIQIMSICVALRWMGGLYRGVVTGSECLVWLSNFNIVMATLRTVGVFIAMGYFGFNSLVFFIHQLVIIFAEVIFLYFKSAQILPKQNQVSEYVGWSLKPIKSVLKFSITLGFTSSVWVLITQSDKMILSGILTLSEYGVYTLAVLVASGIILVSNPISNAIMPRMARLYAESNITQLISVYCKATQIVTIIAGTAGIVIIFYGQDLLYSWTGDLILAKKAAPILQLYATGNILLALISFPYYLQYAKGQLRYHLYGNLIMVILLVPSVVLAAKEFGAIGAGWVWVCINTFFLIVWVAYIHHKLEPGLHFKWLFKNVLSILVPSFFIAYIFHADSYNNYDRLESLLLVIKFTIPVFLTALVCSSLARDVFLTKILKIRVGL